MAEVQFLSVYPTADIHLVLDMPNPFKDMTVNIVVDERFPNVGLNLVLSSIFGPGIVDFDSTVVDVDLSSAQSDGKVTFSPIKIGQAYVPLRYIDDDETVHVLPIRVRVHQSISNFWIGNEEPLIFQSEDNFLLSVYAEFDDGTVGDVSAHPYLNFTKVSPPSKTPYATVNVSSEGRLTGSVTGNSFGYGAVCVRIEGSTIPPQTIDVCVKSPLMGSIKRMARLIKGNVAEYRERRNLLILGDGFSNEDHNEFDRQCLWICEKMFESPSSSPFNLLSHKFNVWTHYEGSIHRGVTVGPRLEETGIFYPEGTWKEIVGINSDDGKIAKPRDSFFGFIYGSRPGSLRSRAFKSSYQWMTGSSDDRRALVKEIWHKGHRIPRLLTIDPRRATKDTYEYSGFIRKYLASIEAIDDSDISRPRIIQIGLERWTTGMEDQSLVLMLVNGQRWGGAGIYGLMFVESLGRDSVYRAELDEPFIVNAGGGGSTEEAAVAVDKVLHEFGHAMGLGDEYEAFDQEGLGAVSNLQAEQSYVITHPNLTHASCVISGEYFYPDKLKWSWHRMEHVSSLVEPCIPTTGSTGQQTYTATVRGDFKEIWQKYLANGDSAYLRTNLRELRNQPTTGPLELAAVDEMENPDFIGLKMNIVSSTAHNPVNNNPNEFTEGCAIYTKGVGSISSPAVNPVLPSPIQNPASYNAIVSAHWKGAWEDALTKGSQVYIGEPNVPVIGPMKILSTSVVPASSGTPERHSVVLEVAEATPALHSASNPSFNTGSLLYVPKKDPEGNSLSLTHPLVLNYMIEEGAPLSTKDEDCEVNTGTEKLDDDIDGFTEPDRLAEVVGLHEGGGRYNCDVFRSSGMCRMRDMGQFCFVCQYIIVDQIDPERHPQLDERYPGGYE